ncbi:MAG TPA: NAD(P)/FAD-dependent oxidoreductase [Glaciibacter sp.]|nr:NAD(P)/FAD-dependent oxidoreductase [Glaciibacter sp.]
MTDHYDVVVLGAGPAGLAAGLSLVRARRSTLLIDSNRPRNAATLHSHGFITRDGISPLELRRLGREDFEKYPDASFHSALVRTVVPVADLTHERARFAITTKGLRGEPNREITAESVLIATGLAETLPALPSIRAWYGTNLHSCIECDGYEKSDAALALIGETNDLAESALLISRWSNDVIIFTNAVGVVSDAEEAALAARGIAVDRRPIADVAGEQGAMTGVQMEDGEFIPRDGGFVRPQWTPAIQYLDSIDLAVDADGLVIVDEVGRSSIPGLYAAGDSTPPGADQLIIAAGSGARAAGAINRDLLGPL